MTVSSTETAPHRVCESRCQNEEVQSTVDGLYLISIVVQVYQGSEGDSFQPPLDARSRFRKHPAIIARFFFRAG